MALIPLKVKDYLRINSAALFKIFFGARIPAISKTCCFLIYTIQDFLHVLKLKFQLKYINNRESQYLKLKLLKKLRIIELTQKFNDSYKTFECSYTYALI